MEIVYRTGDIFETESPVIIHGCNAQGAFNAGFARQVRELLPFAYTAYRQAYLKRGLRLGDVIWAIDIGEGRRSRIVGNAITQADYGAGGRQYVDYDAIRLVLREVDHFVSLSHKRESAPHPDLHVREFGEITTVSMPMIGAGLGGGDWDTIAAIIDDESQHFTPIVYRRDGQMPT